MRIRAVMWMLVLCAAVASLSARQQSSAQPSTNTKQQDTAQFRAALDRYCVTCHNERLRTAQLSLEKMDIGKVGESAPTWEKVVRKLRTGQMPPVGLPRPDAASVNGVASYLEAELDRAAAAKANPGRPVAHRLNRTEYANAIRDLLAVEVDTPSLLPADDAGRGFDNIGDVLTVSPLLTERYIATARKISRMVVGDTNVRSYTAPYDISRRLVQDDRVSEDLPFGSRGGIAVRHDFPLDAEYIIKVRLQRNNDNYVRGLGEPHQIDVRLDGERIKLFTVGGEHKGRSAPIYSFINKDYRGDPEQELYETLNADAGLEVRLQVKAGTHVVGVAFFKDNTAHEGVANPRQNYDELMAYKGGEPAIDNVAITGPFNPKGLGETASRQKLFVCYPGKDKNSGGLVKPVSLKEGAASDAGLGEEACAKKILSTLARRAYRRPVGDRDLESLMNFYKIGRKDGDFEAGITTAVQGILVSPEFLFRVERDPAGVEPGKVYRVSDLELASRLAFFLWSSVPDAQLLSLAEAGKLKDAAVMDQQVKRMLADSRSLSLVNNFVGQWINLRRLDAISPDPKMFPDFDDNLRDAFRRESELLAQSIARENRSVLDFLNADYTYVNERLARHYGIPNVYGSEFRRVPMGDNRKGLLGEGSVLMVTSYANRTAPTLRGKWVLENILGTPPPPPPPNVPSLKEGSDVGRTMTMRQRLEQHRANPACAVCHSRMDPLGFALENFDALGKWRAEETAGPIDPSGTLPDGTKIKGPDELRKVLSNRPEQFAITLTEKLLMYALGRGLEYYDEPVVRSIVRGTAQNNYRWNALILGIVKSTPFQMRRTMEQ